MAGVSLVQYSTQNIPAGSININKEGRGLKLSF